MRGDAATLPPRSAAAPRGEREGLAERAVMAARCDANSRDPSDVHVQVGVGGHGPLAVRVDDVVLGGREISRSLFTIPEENDGGDDREVSHAACCTHDANRVRFGGMPLNLTYCSCAGFDRRGETAETSEELVVARDSEGEYPEVQLPDSEPSETDVDEDEASADGEEPGGARRSALDPVRMKAMARSERSLEVHARYLQFVFRRARMRADSLRLGNPWTRGGMRRCYPLWRPVHGYRCHSSGVASEDEFRQQAAAAQGVLEWYAGYVRALARLTGRTPGVVSGFCGAGGADEGIRRAGAVSQGIDLAPQSDYSARFGAEHFVQGDARDERVWSGAAKKCQAFLRAASPPCQPFSTGRRGEPSQPALLGEIRGLLERSGSWWWMENVLGAARSMAAGSAVLRGAWFGLRVDRGRRFETNFPVHIDAALLAGEDLRARTCLGGRRRWLRLDPFGRPVREACCSGNIFAVQGGNPTRSSVAENARAMGIDVSHMRWAGLAQAIPPAYAQLLVGQAAMHACAVWYGMPTMTYDDYVRDPSGCRGRMLGWLRGAGEASPSAGLELVGAVSPELRAARAADDLAEAASTGAATVCSPESREGVAQGVAREWDSDDWSLPEAEFRALYYGRGGDAERCIVGADAPCWLEVLTAAPRRESLAEALGEGRILVHVREARLDEMMSGIVRAAHRGQRFLILAPDGGAGAAARGRRLRAAGFVSRRTWDAGTAVAVGRSGESRGVLERGVRAWSCGRRRAREPEVTLDYGVAAEHMDPVDAGREPKENPMRKLERAWEPIPLEPERWRGKGLKPSVVRLMTEGAEVQGPDVPGYYEIPQYPFAGDEHMLKGGEEADRAISAGSMEYVPDHLVDALLADCIVHPWLVVHQGSDKWRACQDYKNGTNLFNDALPFGLPSVWSVRRVVKKGSFFAKYDVRDGFWHVPVSAASRRRLLVRHPMNGRLMWATRLPFGYSRSPELFCMMTQEIADEFHKRHPDIKAHVFVFVDDYLVVGDDEDSCRHACAALEEMFAEFGIQWAPHKRRGPAQCIEFLGLLMCNVEGQRCIGLTEQRLERVKAEVAEWSERRPRPGSPELRVEAVELARLLGHLVFVSQVVPGGRPAMLSMMSSFRGLLVDWKRGKVSVDGTRWRLLGISEDFWEDLEWWRDHVGARYCVPMEYRERRVATVAGTDASGWGAGGLVWIDGHREEIQLRFTEAERAHPINWRELLGIVRVVSAWGRRLRGGRLLIETDNMTACTVGKKRKAKVAAMQELVRRLVDLGERYDIELTLTHTPGAKLDRPDQTSRGDAVEEPRQRLGADVFGTIARSFGPFTEFVGAERWHDQPTAASAASVRLWLHPSFATVGSALRLMTTRLRESREWAEGVIVVPDDPGALWWTMTRSFSVEGRLAVGSQIEEARIGGWCPARSRREALVLRYPRSAGSFVRRVESEGQGVILSGALLLRRSTGGATGPARRASSWEMFSLVESWPSEDPADLAFGGEHLTVRRVETVREKPSELIVVATGGEIVVSTMGLVRVGGALARSSTDRRNRLEYSIQWCAVVELAERVLGPAEDTRVEERSAVEEEGGEGEGSTDEGSESESAERPDPCGGTEGPPAAALAQEPPKPAPPAQSGWSWSFGFGAHALGRAEPAAPVSLGQPVGEDSFPEPVPVGLPVDRGGGTWPTPNIRGPAAPVLPPLCKTQGCSRPAHPAPGGGFYEHCGRAHADAARGTSRAATPGSANTIPSRVPQGGDFDAAGHAQGAYEQYDPSARGQEAIHGRAEALRIRLEEMSIGRTPQKCVQRSLTCDGCDRPIVPGEMMVQSGSKWVHAEEGCEVAGAARHQARAAASARDAGRQDELGTRTGPAPPQSTAGVTIEKKKVTLENVYSDARVGACLACLNNECGKMADKLFCQGCDRGVHAECAYVTRTATLGVMRCTFCRLKEMKVTEPYGPQTLAMATRRMITELNSRLESTAQGHLGLERLQADFLNDRLDQGGSMAKPFDNAESFGAMLEWLVLSGRGSRLDSFLISAPAYFKDTGRDDLLKVESVKHTIRKMKEVNPTKSAPKTTATPLLFSEVLMHIPRYADTDFLAARELFSAAFEGCTGARCGELFGAQTGHGVMAGGVAILTWVGGGFEAPPSVQLGEVFVEVATETSKTKVGRCVSTVGETKGPAKVELAKHLRAYWSACGFEITTRHEEGWKVERPDFYVVQIPLLGVTHDNAKMSAIRDWLGPGPDATAIEQVAIVARPLKIELAAKARMKEPTDSKMFINVVCGPKAGEALRRARDELSQRGVMSLLVKGPLIMKTVGKTRGAKPDSIWIPMPLQLGSTYDFLHRVTDAAYASLKEKHPEMDLRLGGQREEPSFAHNSFRRMAATAAEAARQAKRCEKEDVDLHFGWNLRKHAKQMRLHYAERGARACRARMTELI